MSSIKSLEIFAVDLPFRKPFKHAAAERLSSDSLFVKVTTDTGQQGIGECLPRKYVTGETRDGAYDLLKEKVLPKLVGKTFASFQEVEKFLCECDGKSPKEWVSPSEPQTAAWCSIDLALLDTFSREFSTEIFANSNSDWPKDLRYSAVASMSTGFKTIVTALKIKLFGLSQVKVKVDSNVKEKDIKRLRSLLGKKSDIRVDANMGWTVTQALTEMQMLAKYGITSFEQPIAAQDIDGLAQLVEQTGLGVMVDESFHDKASLQTLLECKACTAINLRISKCGGLMASMNRCHEAQQAGLDIQIGCQVGESSVLSAAHTILASNTKGIKYLEGCFGLLLLREDPGCPVMQFKRGGKPPERSSKFGLGIEIDEDILKRWTVRSNVIS